MSTKVLYDTDIGTDVDDAVCLAYLLANPECDLLGITTVTGESDLRARMASAMCKVAGRDVPIFPGACDPLLVPQKQTQAQQAVALERWPHERDFPRGEATRFMRDTILANPGEVVLLAVGPMTNLGLLFATHPEVIPALRSLVLMCGVFTNARPHVGPCEWNAIGDPHATAIVYKARPTLHRSIGLDVTTQVRMPADEVRQRFQHELLRPVLDFAEVWFKRVDRIIFHDPLAAVTIFDPDVCTYARGMVDVELTSPALQGLTHWHPEDAGPHEIALGVDAERVFSRYFEHLT